MCLLLHFAHCREDKNLRFFIRVIFLSLISVICYLFIARADHQAVQEEFQSSLNEET